VNLVAAPYNWNSLFRPIEYTYEHALKVADSVNNNSGYAQWQFSTVFTPLPVVGERFIVTSGTYKGIHVITSVDSSFLFTTSSAYIGGAGAVSTIHERLPEIKLYKGYLVSEAYYDADPITLVATFKPKTSIDNNVQIDVSGFLQSAFDLLVTPSEGVDNNLFSKFRLYFDDEYKLAYNVAYTAIDSESLDSLYANTGRYLVSTQQPYLLSCGTTVLSRIEADAVFNSFYEGSVEGEEFDTDFDTDFSTE